MTIREMQARNQKQDTADTISERLRTRAICDRAVKEREERWPVLTPENAQEAIDWQTKRISELIG